MTAGENNGSRARLVTHERWLQLRCARENFHAESVNMAHLDTHLWSCTLSRTLGPRTLEQHILVSSGQEDIPEFYSNILLIQSSRGLWVALMTRTGVGKRKSMNGSIKAKCHVSCAAVNMFVTNRAVLLLLTGSVYLSVVLLQLQYSFVP